MTTAGRYRSTWRQLQNNGYTYQSKLYDTAISGTSVLCAACHSDNALALPGITGIKSLTADMHTAARTAAPGSRTGQTLDVNSETSDQNSCYLCHPGPTTLCKRGAMSTQLCADCHGNLSTVGKSTRTGWLDVPSCQMCHNNSLRYTTTFTSNGTWRQTNDTTFATNPNGRWPARACTVTARVTARCTAPACHGSPHAEFPTLQANDNVYSKSLQGHTGKIAECSVCHTAVPTTANGGPHNMHNLGQKWVNGHPDLVEKVGVAELRLLSRRELPWQLPVQDVDGAIAECRRVRPEELQGWRCRELLRLP